MISSRQGLLAVTLLGATLGAGCLGKGTLNNRCFDTGQEVIQYRCLGCHSLGLTGEGRQGANPGYNYDTEGDVYRQLDAIEDAAITTADMPPEGGLSECNKQVLKNYIDALRAGPCIPSCIGRFCSDGCGGDCGGSCGVGEGCDVGTGQCIACTPSCQGRVCGSDGCGGFCGTRGGDCPSSYECDVATGACVYVCVPNCAGKSCGPDGCGGVCPPGCGANQFCDATGTQCICKPNCSGKQCGPDGCGGQCGTCRTIDGPCTPAGVCTCTADCTNPDASTRECGPDGCGFTCGTCAGSEECTSLGACLCVPDCAGKQCGSDGCGGTCGTCASGQACDGSGTCAGCTPTCSNSNCATSDGCGGWCGTTCPGNPPGQICNTNTRVCSLPQACAPDCTNRECGSNGCVSGVHSGNCAPGCSGSDTCTAAGRCVGACTPSCLGKACGSDGCAGSCGTCGAGLSCNTSSGDCVCVPTCGTRECGVDICGTPDGCGTCSGTDQCNADGQCVACVPDCRGKQCGSDGCGGTCGPLSGACPAGYACKSDGVCGCLGDCGAKTCGYDTCYDDAVACGSCPCSGCGVQETTCSPVGECVCDSVANCAGKECGSDGCGSADGCGICPSGATCNAGQCEYPPKSFRADVWPIFAPTSVNSCSGSSCHTGARPKANLDLSSCTSSTSCVAFDNLVNVPADAQCSGKPSVLVTPFEPSLSYLMTKLTSSGCSGTIMPGGSAPDLTQSQLDIVRAWIGSGALR